MKQKNVWFIGLLLVPALALGQRSEVEGMRYLDENRRPIYRKNIVIPDVGEYQVLKCDFHTHTIFSDGHVWPNVRNQEAWQEGLDAYAITDHVEYTPHKEDVTVNHNRGYELLKESAAMSNLILVKGSEITRNTPPGHFNALYIGDASGYIESREAEQDRTALMKAAEQGAFIFWNHPGWQPTIAGSYEWIPFVDDLYKNKALQAGRTVAWASKYLVGKEENVRALFNACVKLMPAHYTGERKNGNRINHNEIRNNSDLYFELTLKEGDATKQVVLYPRSTQLVTASEGTSSLTGEVTSTNVRSDRHLVVNFPLK